MDYASGGMGAPDFENFHNSLYASYMLGRDQGNKYPQFSTTQSASMQYMYDQYVNSPATLRHLNPTTVANSYGLGYRFKHSVLGIKHDLGTNFINEKFSADEDAAISVRSAGFDIGGSVAAIAASSVGGIGLGAIVGYAASSAKDEFFNNYRMTERVNAMTAGIRGSNGSYGLKGSENANIAKFIKTESAKDMLVSSDDFENILSTSVDTGLMNGISSAQEFKSKAREMKKLVEGLADAIGSSDVKGLVQAMANFSRMGVNSASSQASMVHETKIASQFAGISQAAMNEHITSAVANAKATGQDTRLAILHSQAEAENMGMIQQSGLVSSSMFDKRTYLEASKSLTNITKHYNQASSGGLSMDAKIVYAGEMAKENGTSPAIELEELLKYSNNEQSSIVWGKSHENRKIMQAILHPAVGRALASQVRGIGKAKIEGYEFANMVESAIKSSGSHDISTIASTIDMMTGNQYQDPKMFELLMAKTRKYLEGKERTGTVKGGIDNLTKGYQAAQAIKSREAMINSVTRGEERKGLINTIGVAYDRAKTYFSTEVIGGFDFAASQEKRRKDYLESTIGTSPSEPAINFSLRVAKEKGKSFNEKYAILKRLGGLDDESTRFDAPTHDSYKTKLNQIVEKSIGLSHTFNKGNGNVALEATGNIVKDFLPPLISDILKEGAHSSKQSSVALERGNVTPLTLDLMSSKEKYSIIGTPYYEAALEAKFGTKNMSRAGFILRSMQDGMSSEGYLGAVTYAMKAARGMPIGGDKAANEMVESHDSRVKNYIRNLGAIRTEGTRTKKDTANAIKFGNLLAGDYGRTFDKSEVSSMIDSIESAGEIGILMNDKGKEVRLNYNDRKRYKQMYEDIRKNSLSEEDARDKMFSLLSGGENTYFRTKGGKYKKIKYSKRMLEELGSLSKEERREIGQQSVLGNDEEIDASFKLSGITSPIVKAMIKDTGKEIKESRISKYEANSITAKDVGRAARKIFSLKNSRNRDYLLFDTEGEIQSKDFDNMSYITKRELYDSKILDENSQLELGKNLVETRADGSKEVYGKGKQYDFSSKVLETASHANSVFTNSSMSAEQLEGMIKAMGKEGDAGKAFAYLEKNNINPTNSVNIVKAARKLIESTGDTDKAIGAIGKVQEQARNALKVSNESIRKVMGVDEDVMHKIIDIQKGRGSQEEKDIAIKRLELDSGVSKSKVMGYGEAVMKAVEEKVFGKTSTYEDRKGLSALDYADASRGNVSLELGAIVKNTDGLIEVLNKIESKL